MLDERFDLRRPDGAVLAVRTAGAERPAATAVLVHGWTMTGASWQPVVDRVLAERPDVAVVRPDQRDHGDSRPAPGGGEPSIAVLADDLAAVVDRAAPQGPVVLAGHSMGGMSVLAAVDRHPDLRDRLAGVLLVNTAADRLRPRPWVARVMRLLAAAPAAVRVPRVPGPLARRYGYGRSAPPDVVRRVRAGVPPPTARSTGGWYLALSVFDGTGHLRALDGVPVTVLAGQRDRLTPPEHSARLAARLPGARVEVVPGAGHMLMFEHPDRVAAALLDLLPVSGGRS